MLYQQQHIVIIVNKSCFNQHCRHIRMFEHDKPGHLFDATVYRAQGAYNLTLNEDSQCSSVRQTFITLDFRTLCQCVGGIAMDAHEDVCTPFICVCADSDRTVVVVTIIVEIIRLQQPAFTTGRFQIFFYFCPDFCGYVTLSEVSPFRNLVY